MSLGWQYDVGSRLNVPPMITSGVLSLGITISVNSEEVAFAHVRLTCTGTYMYMYIA